MKYILLVLMLVAQAAVADGVARVELSDCVEVARSGSTTGALTGSAVGAGLGAGVGGWLFGKSGAAIGAVIGGVGGGAVGENVRANTTWNCVIKLTADGKRLTAETLGPRVAPGAPVRWYKTEAGYKVLPQ